jgi:hypothetical protein
MGLIDDPFWRGIALAAALWLAAMATLAVDEVIRRLRDGR